MSVMRDMSHSPIGPCGPLRQSLFGDRFTHSKRALLNSALSCGENTEVGVVEPAAEGVVEHIVNVSTAFLSSELDCGENATWTTKGPGEGEMGRVGQV